jgi:hypothetical protein
MRAHDSALRQLDSLKEYVCQGITHLKIGVAIAV